MLVAQPIVWFRELSILGTLFVLGYLAGVAEVVSWSFIHREQLGMLKFVPFAMVAFPVVAAAFLSTPIARLMWLSVKRNWPLACLCLYMSIGGLYTRISLGSSESFFSHSLAMLTFFFTWTFATRVGPDQVAVQLLRATAPFWLVMLGVVMYGFATGRHMAHEIMYVFTPLPLFFGLRSRSTMVRLCAFFAIVAIAAMGLKNTTLIIGALSGYLLFIFSQDAVRKGERPPFNLRALFVFVVCAGIAYWGWSQLTANVADFSSGNTDFRKYNYLKLWHKFLGSPIYGDEFVGTPNLVFDLYEIDIGTQNLPSHSDVLDVLAHGGIIGASLLALFVVGFGRSFIAACKIKVSDEVYAARVTLFAMSAGALFTMTSNPVWANTTNAFMFWSILGLCQALCNPKRDHESGGWMHGGVPRETEVSDVRVAA